MSLAARVAAASRVRLLFLHATGFCKEVWAPCLAHLVSMVPTSQTATFDWLDFPGHGTRGHVRDTNWSDWGASLAPVVLDHLAGPPDAAAAAATAAQSDNADVDGQPLLVVVGHSMGAAAAALTELAAPGTFSGMVLFEPIIMDDEMRAVGTPLGDMARRRRASYPSPDDALRRWRGRGAFEGWDDRALRAYVHAGLELRGDGQYHLRCTPEVEGSIYDGGNDGWPRLPELDLPVHVMAGGASEHMPPGHFRRLADEIRGSHFVELPELKHFVPMEAPEVAAVEIAAALGWCDAGLSASAKRAKL